MPKIRPHPTVVTSAITAGIRTLHRITRVDHDVRTSSAGWRVSAWMNRTKLCALIWLAIAACANHADHTGPTPTPRPLGEPPPPAADASSHVTRASQHRPAGHLDRAIAELGK